MALPHRQKSPLWRGESLPDQTGRTFVVTGAGGGLGLETSRRLAQTGARVIMAVRSKERAQAAVAAIEASRPRGSVELGLVDLSSLESVRNFAESLDHVDVLINNAGVMALPLTLSADGFEMQFATNYLGHFALSNLLLPKLTDRVVTVSSTAHSQGEVHLDDFAYARRPYSRARAYADSKLAQLMFMSELQRRLTAAGSTLRSVGAHPGYSSTGIVTNTGSKIATKIGNLGNSLFGMDVAQGALPQLYAALMDVPGNSFIGPHGPGGFRGYPVQSGRSRIASDPDLARDLWETTEKLAGVSFPL